jgi:hypothetical protein
VIPVRAGGRRVLISLHRDHASLARLRRRPEVALSILALPSVRVEALQALAGTGQ